MSSWKGLSKRRDRFAELDAALVGVSADTPELLSAFRRDLGLPFTMLADPELRSAEALDLPISTRKAYTGSLLLHPEIRHYPKKAFLQPAILIFDGAGELRYRWTHTEKITNLWGARGRPSPEAILELTRESLS